MATPQYESVSLLPDTTNKLVTGVGVTATNYVYVASDDWTITVPAGAFAAIATTAVTIQVNNFNPVSPDSANRNVNPVALSLQSVARTSASAQGTVDPQFENNWTDWGNLSTSAFAGSGNYRYIRLVPKTPAATGLNPSFSAFVWSYHQAPMV
jgi:hypothetical protein